MAIQFPRDNLYDGREYTPPGSSITYVYSLNQGWLLLPSEVPVSKDYVDTQDFLKYDKSGGKISGNVSVGEFGGREHLFISSTGEIRFANTSDLMLTFTPSVNKPAKLKVTDTVMMSVGISASQFDIFKTINLEDPTQVFFKYLSPNSNTEVDILKAPESNYNIANVISLSNKAGSSLVIKGKDEAVFTISGNGRVLIKSNEQDAFSVKRRDSAETRDVLEVSTYNYKINSSSTYNDGLISGGATIKTPTGNETYVAYTDDTLLATLGLVKKFQYTPGQKVFADIESETEIGGLWSDSTGFYIRYK